MAVLTIHPQAAEALNARANSLISLVSANQERRVEGWQPDLVPKATITDTDIIGEPDSSLSSLDGTRRSLEFVSDGTPYTLRGEGYKQLLELCKLVLKDKTIQRHIAAKSVENVIRDWVRSRFRQSSVPNFCDFLLAECNGKVFRHHVWVLIERLYVQQSFSLGSVTIRPITREFLDNLISQKTEELRAEADERIRRYQGHSAATLYVDAEPEKARAVALEKTERALAVLSLLAPSAMLCTAVTASDLWGTRKWNAASTFLFVEDQLKTINEGVLGPMPLSHTLDIKDLAKYAPLMKAFNLLLVADLPDSFAEKVVDALLVYRRAVGSPDPAEKLIYVFVALEMIFLRNANEAVQDNVATRIAFLIGGTVDERRAIISTIKGGYALRSAFIHHGVAVTNKEAANEFLVVAWKTLIAVVNATQRYGTHDHLIQYLEDRKLQ